MILDMIQGCQYLRRSTDRWLLSKNSTTQLEGLESWHMAGLLSIVRSLLQTLRVHIYTLVLTRLIVDHDYNIYCLMASCPSHTHHQFVSFLYTQSTSSRVPGSLSLSTVEQLSCRMMTYSQPQTHLPNALRKTSCRMVLFLPNSAHKSSLFPVPIFGVNSIAQLMLAIDG
jgi:hypothetical protein